MIVVDASRAEGDYSPLSPLAKGGRQGGRAGRALGLVLAAVCALSCAACGPRMRNQQSIRPFERQMPKMPANTVPTTGSLAALTAEESKLVSNPLAKTETNLQNGEVYYGYYCRMCHGADGRGSGPVGESYVPKPTDLSSPAIAKLTDGQVHDRMLRGVGHDPAMLQTVPPTHRWPIVMYLRNLQQSTDD